MNNLATIPLELAGPVLLGAQTFLLLLTVVLAAWARSKRAYVPDAFAPSYTPGAVTKLLVRFGGNHPSELNDLGAGAYWRAAVCGIMLFIASGMAFFGIWMWMGAFQSIGPATSVVVSLVGAAMIFALDLGIVTTISQSTGLRGTAFVIVRVALAVVLGMVVAKPYLVLIYSSEIGRLQNEKKLSAVETVESKSHAARERFATQQLPFLQQYQVAADEVRRRITALAPRTAELRTQHASLHQQYVTEVTKGQNGRKDGRGSYAIFLEQEMAKVQKEIDSANAEEQALNGELNRLAKEREERIKQVLNNPQFAATAAAYDSVMNATAAAEKPSLAGQLDMLEEYVAAGGSRRRQEYWLFHLLIILLDTAPVLTKLAMGRNDVKMAARIREDRLFAEMEVLRGLAGEHAHERATQKHASEMRREQLTALVKDADILFQAAAHVVLRYVQVVTETRKAFAALAGKVAPEPHPEADRRWEEASKPLARVQETLLARLTQIITGDKRPPNDNSRGSGLN